jgi:hypothetical protein
LSFNAWGRFSELGDTSKLGTGQGTSMFLTSHLSAVITLVFAEKRDRGAIDVAASVHSSHHALPCANHVEVSPRQRLDGLLDDALYPPASHAIGGLPELDPSQLPNPSLGVFLGYLCEDLEHNLRCHRGPRQA